MKSNKTVVVAPAIKTKFWKKIYLDFCRAKTEFHIVFVGHVKPDFKLPDNFTYINCSLGPAECSEIAYRYAYKHVKDAQFIINIADDVTIPEYFLDNLIDFYYEQEKKQNNDFVIVSPIYNGHLDQENLMSLYSGGPVLLGPMLTTIDNSKKIGGIDRRFKGVYWDSDRHLRAHALGASVVLASAKEVSPVKEIEYLPTGGLWKKHSGHDRKFLDGLWDIQPGGDLQIFCSSLQPIDGRPTNVLEKKNLILKRRDEVIEYDDYYLKDYYE